MWRECRRGDDALPAPPAIVGDADVDTVGEDTCSRDSHSTAHGTTGGPRAGRPGVGWITGSGGGCPTRQAPTEEEEVRPSMEMASSNAARSTATRDAGV
jgi:hypothetical protein